VIGLTIYAAYSYRHSHLNPARHGRQTTR
jgi:hypothetical protein